MKAKIKTVVNLSAVIGTYFILYRNSKHFCCQTVMDFCCFATFYLRVLLKCSIFSYIFVLFNENEVLLETSRLTVFFLYFIFFSFWHNMLSIRCFALIFFTQACDMHTYFAFLSVMLSYTYVVNAHQGGRSKTLLTSLFLPSLCCLFLPTRDRRVM